MRDFARSDSAAVQAQLDRLAQLSVPDGRLGLETIRALLGRLGNPHRRLPPVFHVAGTNGKGSTCAFLRAMLEAQGYSVHMTTSPHLVRYNERIRIAGDLITDARLAELLAEVLDAGESLNPSFFEVTIAAAFTEFARIPADACIVEVGLGGRFDATNVLEPEVLAACGIAALGIDHEKFLLAPEDGVPSKPVARIAFEKAGIAKKDVPLVILARSNPPEAEAVIESASHKVGAHLVKATSFGNGAIDAGAHDYPAPGIRGPHQERNAALAHAMLRSQSRLAVGEAAIRKGIERASWPARMQLLQDGPLTSLAGTRQVWLDGGHNPNAGEAVAMAIKGELHLVLGMLDNKDPRALIEPFGNRARSLTIVPVPGHETHPLSAFGKGARSAADIEEALRELPADEYPVLIAGSLYLAGEVLRLNDELPD
ncbi:bifunctional folylpolyglutamate synthase/dihydrofolate synthase [Qipengyuania seohaensis]|uniref:bifunctional folylpolyglutamate synthase/dihydrofolate synthase n=1 Tax=Qipengyuania seohaensis TaxID=266951 RepID=UPI000C2246BD|nr:folylpolyglutamate synthase/dihydrofolate synthase family protein [Qipengyuania seohaensis]